VRTASIAFAALSTTLTIASGASPGPTPGHASTAHLAMRTSLGPAALRYGLSLGSPTEGHLIGGAHLMPTEYLRIEPADTAGDVRWGLEPLVGMLDRAGRVVRHQYPGAMLSVGHLSREGGGDIDQHRSHESGRDADVAFYVKSAAGKQLLSPHFVQFRADGTAPTWPGAYFDDARNWSLVAALVGDAEAHVTHLFVASPLRARLLAYAERAGAPQAVRMRAAELMQQPHGVLPHDDHFHVRIGCPARMNACVENPTLRVVHAGHALDGPAERRVASDAPRGHHGPPTHALITPAPRRAAMPAATPASAPELAPGNGPAADPAAEPEPEPNEPPARLALPIDDVDG
jgi:penicillin-insensitive murein endopeptidase